jgi:hypothetical protein
MGGGGAQADSITAAKTATTVKTNIFFIFPSPENWYLAAIFPHCYYRVVDGYHIVFMQYT